MLSLHSDRKVMMISLIIVYFEIQELTLYLLVSDTEHLCDYRKKIRFTLYFYQPPTELKSKYLSHFTAYITGRWSRTTGMRQRFNLTVFCHWLHFCSLLEVPIWMLYPASWSCAMFCQFTWSLSTASCSTFSELKQNGLLLKNIERRIIEES